MLVVAWAEVAALAWLEVAPVELRFEVMAVRQSELVVAAN
jgi:hypothetical protein